MSSISTSIPFMLWKDLSRKINTNIFPCAAYQLGSLFSEHFSTYITSEFQMENIIKSMCVLYLTWTEWQQKSKTVHRVATCLHLQQIEQTEENTTFLKILDSSCTFANSLLFILSLGSIRLSNSKGVNFVANLKPKVPLLV